MKDRFAAILVLLAMLPQLALGMGSGRVLEICFCGFRGAHAVEVAALHHDHDHHHSHAHRHACEEHASTDDPGDQSGWSCEERIPTDGSCNHVVIAGQYGRSESVQTWAAHAFLLVLSNVCIDVAGQDGAVPQSAPPREVKPPGDLLFAVTTTSFQI
jgi:hypothetical protein